VNLPQIVSEILRQHVTLEVESIDRMYLNVYVPSLQYEGGVAMFFRGHRKQIFASSALMAPMTRAFLSAIDPFVERESIPIVTFAKGQRKDDIAAEYLSHFQGGKGILFVGKAQEKATVFRTEKRRNPQAGKTYPWIVRSTAMVNQYYFYSVDRDFGPFFLKFCSHFPYTARLCLNGHEYAKRQLTRAGIAFEALENGSLSCADPKRLQAVCDRLSSRKVETFLRKWLARLPHPFTAADRKAGYRYAISMLQSEFSLTQVLDSPHSGRVLFEQIIREHLDLGCPDRVQLILQRRVTKRTPGRFRTRVITQGVMPSLHVGYKHSHIKQYHKENRALRTETTVNNPRDFAIGKRLNNLPAVREIGFRANRRLLDVQCLSQDCTTGEEVLRKANRPLMVGRQRESALRFADLCVKALLDLLVMFRLLPMGFGNADLCEPLAALLGIPPQEMTPGRMTYHLRRLRLHSLIERIPGSRRYSLAKDGFRLAMVYSRSYARILRPAVAFALPFRIPSAVSLALARRFSQLDQAVNRRIDHAIPAGEF
jgi:hypothetical protein